MATLVDYRGRTVDVAAFLGWERGLGREALLEQTLTDEALPGGGVLTGVLKLVQRFLLILLTEQGSLVYLPEAGCRFMSDAGSGRWRTSADVFQSFNFSLLDVKRQLRQLETEADPDDEKFLDAAVLGITLSPQDQAVLRLQLTTQAGTRRVFVAPIGVATR